MTQPQVAGVPWAAAGLLLGALLLLAAGVVLLIRQWRRQLRLSQRQSDWLQRLIDDLDLAVYFLDPQGLVLQWSVAAERLYGYTAAEVLGRHFSVLYRRDEIAGRLPQDILETAARLGRHRSRSAQVRRGGRSAQVETLTEALRDGTGRLIGFTCAARDVSEALQQQQAVRAAHKALAQAQRMVALGRLSGGIAHDFNNVMHIIRTCAEFLQRQGITSAQSAELLQMIKRNADRAAHLSQQLLSVARAPAAAVGTTDVNEVVTAVAQLLRQTLAEDIGVELHLNAALSACAIDRNELEAALLNVAADARDAMPAGGTVEFATLPTEPSVSPAAPSSAEREPSASVTAEQPARVRRYVMVSISHSRRDEARSTNAGQELGLTLIRSLIEESQGRVRIEPHPRGATVQLYLPCRAS